MTTPSPTTSTRPDRTPSGQEPLIRRILPGTPEAQESADEVLAFFQAVLDRLEGRDGSTDSPPLATHH